MQAKLLTKGRKKGRILWSSPPKGKQETELTLFVGCLLKLFDSIRFVSNLPSSPFSSLKQMIFAACFLVISFALFVLVLLRSLSPSPLSLSVLLCQVIWVALSLFMA